jgi:CheY-like chemotaxis protein
MHQHRHGDLVGLWPTSRHTPDATPGALHEGAAASRWQMQQGGRGRAPLILIVEDNRDSGEVLALLLQMAGFDVELALSAYEALDAVRRRQPTLVISDIYMPGLNGFDLATMLREEEGFEHVPLVALSGGNSAIDEHRATCSGFSRYLRKPVDPESLQQLLVALLDRRREPRRYDGPDRRGE